MPTLSSRRWLRFGLRTMFTAMTATAVCLALWNSSARTQKDATAAVLVLGGHVTYEHQAATGKFVENATPPGPTWLRSIVGRDWFDTVHGVGLYSANGGSDDQIAATLRGLPDTRSLQLDGSKAGNVTMPRISQMTYLRNLMMCQTVVDDSGLTHLYRLTNLQNLDLRGTKVSPEGVKKLREALPKCNVLYEGL